MNKQNRKLITCKCDHCQTEFQKPESEYKRNLKLGRENFCTRSCLGHRNTKNIINNRSTYDISQHANNNLNEFTPFKYYLKRIKERPKEINLTLYDLKNQWDKQNGICVYSGVKLILSEHTKISKNLIYTASLDRIDSTKGYIVGNIQFISQVMNYMKHTMSHEQTLDVCQHITNYNKSKN